MSYTIEKTDDYISILGHDQEFTKEDCKDLWKNHNILYRNGGVMAVWVQERQGTTPLIHFMNEDDGHIFWKKEKDRCFDSAWLGNYIETLSVVKTKLRKL